METGYKADVYCKTSSGSVKIYTLHCGSGVTSGSVLGYMGLFEVRMETFEPSLDGWSDADKAIYYIVQEDFQFVVDQVIDLLNPM